MLTDSWASFRRCCLLARFGFTAVFGGSRGTVRQLGSALAEGWQNSSCQPGPPGAEDIIQAEALLGQAEAGRGAGKQRDTGDQGGSQPCPGHSGGREQAGQGRAGRRQHSKEVPSCLALPRLCPARTSEGVRQTDRQTDGDEGRQQCHPTTFPSLLLAPQQWLLGFNGDLGGIYFFF